MSKIQLITMGSDPELFLEDSSGKVISAIGKIGGNKDKPRPIKSLGKGFAVQEDNVLLEYNTPPARSLSLWTSYHKAIRDYLEIMVGQLGLKLSDRASHSMDDDQLDHPNAFVFGCDPDYDVWKMKWNPKPKADDPKLRSAGGHIHVCYTDPNSADSIRIGRVLDYFVGAPLADLDPDNRRRLLYGKPGAIRFKPYGLEYRTPSNFWTLSPRMVEAVYYNVQQAVDLSKNLDDWQKPIETARRFLAGESLSWDRDPFDSLAAQYAPKEGEKVKPLRIYKSSITMMDILNQAVPEVLVHPEDNWDGPTVQHDEEEQDGDQ